MQKHILYLEDDSRIGTEVVQRLESEGYVVTHIKTLMQAEMMDCSKFSLLLFDWNLPDGESIDLLKKLRGQGVTVPLLMLTARTGVADRIEAMRSGTTDFLGKPFHFHELIARIGLLIEQSIPQAIGTHLQTAGDVSLNLKERKAYYKGSELSLTKKEYDLLAFFMANQRTVFTRDEILDAVWGENEAPTNRTVDTHVVQLRKKLSPKLILTVWSMGYRFLPEGE